MLTLIAYYYLITASPPAPRAQGDDYRECGFTFLYVLLLVPARTAIQKLCGFGASREAAKLSAFAMPQEAGK